ncbi:MAG: YIP1 family protein [Euryarchaeota archaeon]|nr:YIP1 family protein [Euryarchaeota archaeon]
MIEILTNPDKFFEVKKGEEVSLKLPALIVLIIGIISGIGAYFMGGLTAEMLSGTLPPEAQAFLSFISISAAITAVIVSFIIWIVFAAIFFLISCIFKGEGKFKRTLEFVGYGYIPMIISGIISAILIYNIVSTAHIPAVTDPAKMAGALEPLLKSPMMQLSYAISILFMLWSANIWVFGLKHARNLTTKNALITVAIPMAASVLWTIYQMGVM